MLGSSGPTRVTGRAAGLGGWMQVQVVEDAEGTWLRVRGPVDYAEAQALVKAGL